MTKVIFEGGSIVAHDREIADELLPLLVKGNVVVYAEGGTKQNVIKEVRFYLDDLTSAPRVVVFVE